MVGGLTPQLETSQFAEIYNEVVIKNVNVLAPDASHFISNQSVVISKGEIVKISTDSIFGEGIDVIDASGKFLIPGLIDAHVHLKESKNDLLLYLTNGVTHIREMSGNVNHLRWKDEIENGALGPKMFVASEKVHSQSGLKGLYMSWTRRRINYATDKAAAKKIKFLKEKGFDALKISTFINKEMYDATIRECAKNDLRAIGHIPMSVGTKGIVAARQNEIAHVEELTKETMRDFGWYNASNANEYIDYLKTTADSIAKVIHDQNISVTTTVFLIETLVQQKFDLENFIKNIEIEYANPGLIEGTPLGRGWLPGNNSYAESEEVMSSPESIEAAKVFWETYGKALHIMTLALVKHNVLIMAGTDANAPIMVPGFSLHDELQSLSKLGMTNSQVLYAASAASGIWMDEKTGMIKPSYKADLVLLKKNPLDNIENTRTIDMVFSGSYKLTSSVIKRIQEEILKNNNRTRNIDLHNLIN